MGKRRRSRAWKELTKKKRSQIKFALTQSKVWANLAQNIKKPPTIVEKEM
jgi:hypothetical protein